MKPTALRIGCLNYADVRNFGDVLFPMVISREIKDRIPEAEIQFINPTGSSWAGLAAHQYGSLDLGQFDGLILGGGEIVHRLDEMLLGIYNRFDLPAIERPTDLVFAWTSCRVPFKAWLALGVPEPSDRVRRDVLEAVRGLDFVGARGSRSAARLAACGAASVHRTPDLGWLFPRLLEGRVRPVRPGNAAPYMVLQALGFPDVESTARRLQRLSLDLGLRIVLLPLTRCWNDAAPLSALRDASGDSFILVDDETSDLDKLAILADATLVIGQSMHGLIGALSHARPGGVCVAQADDKFGELISDLGLQQFRISHWDDVEGLARTLLWSPPGLLTERRANAERELDRLFDVVAAMLISAAGSLQS